MRQGQLEGMQQEGVRLGCRRSVATVPYYRVANMAKMSPDLVGSPGVQACLPRGSTSTFGWCARAVSRNHNGASMVP